MAHGVRSPRVWKSDILGLNPRMNQPTELASAASRVWLASAVLGKSEEAFYHFSRGHCILPTTKGSTVFWRIRCGSKVQMRSCQRPVGMVEDDKHRVDLPLFKLYGRQPLPLHQPKTHVLGRAFFLGVGKPEQAWECFLG